MKSFQMKALALATLGLGGLVMAGSAFAACPDPTANSNQGYATPNGPWSGEFVTNSTIASTTGLAGTNCAMQVAFSGSPVPGNAVAFVQDQSPNNEPRYRVRFYVDLSKLSSSFSVGNQQLILLKAVSNGGPTGLNPAEVTVFLIGGVTASSSPISFRFSVADSGLGGGTGGFKNITIAAPTPAGVNRIEFDYNTGTGSACAPGNAHGSFCAWVTDGAAATGSDGSPTPAAASGIAINPYSLVANSFDSNSITGWSGVKFANFGILSPSAALQTSAAATQILTVDEFDSRRQTFIGQ